MRSNVISKKEAIKLLLFFWLCFLIGDFLLSYIENDIVAVKFYLGIESVHFIVVLLWILIKKHSFLKNAGYLLLAVVNLISPIYWFVIFVVYDCYAPNLLKYSEWFDTGSFLICILLCIYLIEHSVRGSTGDGTVC